MTFTTFIWRCLFICMGLLVIPRQAWADDNDDDDDDFDPLTGRSEAEIDALFQNFDEVIETIAFYAALATTLVIFLVLSLSLRLPRWAAYLALTIVTMIWIAFFEQYTTGLYWIGLRVDFAWLALLGFGLACLHMSVAALSIRPTVRLSWMRYVLLPLAALIWVIPALGWHQSQTQMLYFAVAIIACLSHATAIPSFLSLQGATSTVSRNGTAFAVIMAISGLAALLFGELGEELDLIFLVRLVLFAVVAFFSLFFARSVLSILYERDTNAKLALEAARSDAEKTRALFEAEKNYSRARASARIHTMRLAEASHDIRQPIASLRSTMDAVAKNQTAKTRAQLAAAFDYLDDLAKSYANTGDAENAPKRETDSTDDGLENVSTTMICETLDRMFRKEAEARSLKFVSETEETTLRVQPLALTRVLSNLLSNAIKHTPEGSIWLRGEISKDGFQFSVFNTAQLPRQNGGLDIFESYVRGPGSDGSGLGLSIVNALAEKNGWQLSWTSEQGKGTRFTVLLPRPSILAQR